MSDHTSIPVFETRRGERGLSLVEVVLALGMMAAVLLSVAGMFTLSERQVSSGKTSTEALAVARAIVEEMNGWGFRQTYQLFGLNGSTTTATVYSNGGGYAAKWQARLDQSLQRGSVARIDLAALPPEGGSAPTLANAKAIRVTVTVNWTEGQRPRHATLATVRM